MHTLHHFVQLYYNYYWEDKINFTEELELELAHQFKLFKILSMNRVTQKLNVYMHKI